jgi:hypothetical protein
MTKFSQNLILGVSLAVFLLPILVSGQEKPLNCCEVSREVEVDGTVYYEGDIVGRVGESTDCPLGTAIETKQWSLICLLSSVKLLTDWIFTFLMVFVSIMVILGAFKITQAGGSSEELAKGRNYILYAMFGFVVALLSKGIPDLVESLMGV